MNEKIIKDALKEIMLDRRQYSASLNYAIECCGEAMNLTGEELREKCVCIVKNVKGWRAPQAGEVRRVLKEFVKTKSKKKLKTYIRRETRV